MSVDICRRHLTIAGLIDMSCCVPLMFPAKCRVALRGLYQQRVPVIPLEIIASYLGSSNVTCVASRDGYLRVLFEGTSLVIERHIGPAVWCLCVCWDNIYVALYGEGLKAFRLNGNVELKHELLRPWTYLCLCRTARGVCAGSDHCTFSLFSSELIVLQVVTPEAISATIAQINCCIPMFTLVWIGSEHGELFIISEESRYLCAVKCFSGSEIYSLCLDAHDSFLFVGLGNGIEVVDVVTFASIYYIPFNESVWSISMRLGSDDVLVGLQYDGVELIQIKTDTRGKPCSHHTKQKWSEIGTCAAISQSDHGSWYASSNRCRIYHCNAAGRLDSRCVVHSVWELEERIPRCDTYDIHVIGGLVDRQLLSSARDSCG